MNRKRKAQERAGTQNKRPTIGFLGEHLVDEYNTSMWDGVRDAAQEHGASLLYFSGGILRDPRGFNAQTNMLYDLVGEETVDGLLLWGAQLVHYTTLEELTAFCEQYRPLPIVNIGLALEGISSLLVDSYQGMRDVVAHLIKVHGHRRIAYISGPGDTSESRDRYRGYTDALAEHGIPLDPALVVSGDELMDKAWRKNLNSGAVGVRILLDERGLKPRADLEALATHDDGSCRYALDALQERGLRVPADVALASFDDVQYSRYLIPPLTTARQSFYDLGWHGVEMLLARLRGEEVPERVVLPVEVVVRQSCGCMDPAVVAAGSVGERPGRVASRKKLRAALAGEREMVVAEIAGKMRGSEEAPRWAEQVLDGFIAEVEGESPGAFLGTLDEVLRQVIAVGGDLPVDVEQHVAAWQGVLSVLRQHVLPYLGDDALSRAENLWQQARVLIGGMAQRVQGYQALQAEQRARALREIGAALITTFDAGELMDVLAEGLPRLGIPGAYLSAYEDPQPYTYPQPAPERSRLLLAYDERGRVELEADGRRFRSRQLMPEGLQRRERRYSVVVAPLCFRENQLGFVLLEAGPREGTIYETLRGHISSALQGALLVRHAERRSAQLQTAAEVSRAASSILNPDDLIRQVVELARERFDLYYAGLFLVDETGRRAVLQAGTGEAGQKMLEAGHTLEVGGASMIGWCTAHGQARIALDVGEEAVRFDNPLLPQTRSEMALPLVSRGRIIGALTIQSTQEAAFSQEDIAALQTMASQVANAIENARLLTEHRQAEEALRKSEERYRTILESIQEGYFEVDIAGNFTFFNDALCTILGYPRDELMGMNNREYMDAENAKAVYRAFNEVYRTGRPAQTFGYEVFRKDGTRRSVEVATSLITDPTGEPSGFHGIMRDITERKAAEAERERLLAASERWALQLQTAVEVSRAASSILDPAELIRQAVDLVRERFDLYYVGLFLVDEAGSAGEPGGKWAVLRAGTGEAGQKMLQQGHRLEVGGASMIGWCIAHGQARIALDVGTEAIRFDNPQLPQTRSEMALPLISRGEVIGALTIQSEHEAAFSQETIAVLQTMADQLANAITNTRLFEQAQARTEELAVLDEMARALTATLDVGTVLENVYRHTSRLMDTSNLYVALYDAQKDEVSFPFYRVGGEPVGQVESRQAGKGLSEYVLRTRQPFLVEENIATQLQELGIEMIGREAQSWLGAPMVTGDQVIGVIAVQSYTTPRVYNEHHRDLLSAIANQTAIAVQNARLFEQAQSRATEMAVLNELGQALAAHLNINEVLDEVYRGVSRLMDATNFYVALYDLDKDMITFPLDVTPEEEDKFRTLSADEGLTGYIIRNRTSVLIQENLPERLAEMGVKIVGQPALSWLGVPMMVGDRVLGVLGVQSYTSPHAYDEHDRDLLTALANQTAIAIQNARLFERTQAALRESEATHQRYLLQAWTEYQQAARQAGYEFTLPGSTPLGDAVLPEVRQVMEQHRTVVATGDGGEGEKYSALVTPVAIRGAVIGALGIRDKDRERLWTEDEIALLEAIAERMALAAENLRLFDETQRRVTQEQLLSQISDRMQRSANLEALLHLAAEELNKALGGSRVYVRMGTAAELTGKDKK